MELTIAVAALSVLLVLVILVPIIFLLQLIGWTWTGVPYLPVPRKALKALPEILSLSDDSVVYDLGCGDARVLYSLAARSKARFIGVEKAPFPYLMAKARGLFARNKNVEIVYGDIFSVPLSNATHVYTYLLTSVMKKIAPKFNAELASGATLVSCDFRLPDREPEQTLPLDANGDHVLYRYRF